MLVAYVEIAAGRRILRDARSLKNQLVELLVVALRQSLDLLAADLGHIRAGFREDPVLQRSKSPLLCGCRVLRVNSGLRIASGALHRHCFG
jgi:hypothetical protein